MKRLFYYWAAFILMLGSAACAQTPTGPESSVVLYITRYEIPASQDLVYGVFDLGDKPSIKLVVSNTIPGGKLTFMLHGRYYHQPVEHPFSIRATFEDVTGRVFQESPKIAFDASKQSTSPQWFSNLDNVAGLYGNQTVTIAIPPGTAVINLLAEDPKTTVSPNQLMGYIDHLKLP